MKYVKIALPYVLIVLVLCIRFFVIAPVRVDGPSMNPTLSNGEILLLKQYDHSFKRFDIVVFKYQGDRLIKRIIGLPGDYVEYKDNQLYINQEPVTDVVTETKTNDFSLSELGFDRIPEGYYFVLGDNRGNSSDSRLIGLINQKNILGTVSFSLWPWKGIH